mgnify:CR=1 FL=1
MKHPEKKIKILYTIPNFNTAGSGKALLNVISRIDKNISKQFNLSTGKYITAKERFLHLGKNQSEIFHALNDVSFDVPTIF